MKFTIVIQENPSGYIIEPPGGWDLFHKSREGKKIQRENLSSLPGQSKQEYYDTWKKPVKRYYGFIAGLDITIQAEADTIREVITTIKKKTKDVSKQMNRLAKQDWPGENIIFEEIEI